MDNTEIFYSRFTSKFGQLFSLILHKSNQIIVHILAGEVVKTQIRAKIVPSLLYVVQECHFY